MLLLIFTSSRVYAQQSPIIGTNSDSRIQITIHSFTTATSITYYPNTPSHTGYVWGIADLTITDLQAAGTVSINSLYAHIKDSQNYVYNSEVTLDPQRLNLAELPAGQSQRGNVYWEIPVNTNIASFYWYDYSSNLAIPALATPSPTPTATPIPTPSPTVTPTQAPTTTPTPSVYPPTATPTLTPTANPTLNPNLQPTQSPMPSPTIPELGLFSIGCAALVLVAVLVVAKRWNQKSLS